MKKKSDAPSRVEWKALFDAAKVVGKMEPWVWMDDTDLFGVQNPEDGEIGYCCVTGAAGEVFGLSAYLGAEGLMTYRKMASGEIGVGSEDILFVQKALTATFEDRGGLDNKDLQIIRNLKLRFRGRKAWPQFRSYLPGYVPWYLTAGQSRFLTTILEQAVDVAGRFEGNPELLRGKGEDLVMARLPEKQGDEVIWRDAWIEPEAWEKPKVQSGPVDEIRIHRIGNQLKKGQSDWEIDSFYFPGAVAEGGRPYYPCLSIIVDRASEIVVGSWLNAPWECHSGFQEQVMNHLANSSDLPRTIRVSKGEIRELLAPIARPLKIGLKQVESLEGVSGVRAALVRDLPDFAP